MKTMTPLKLQMTNIKKKTNDGSSKETSFLKNKHRLGDSFYNTCYLQEISRQSTHRTPINQ